MDFKNFENKSIRCSSCQNDVFFELIEDIECDLGTHNVIQCPKCEELFSIDKQCPAFQDALSLASYNSNLMSETEMAEYSKNAHIF